MKTTIPDQITLGEVLTPLQYKVTQEGATEHPFTNKYNDHFEKGVYIDIVSGEPLFSSEQKFRSSCGWPSFTAPITESATAQQQDTSCNMVRTEVVGSESESHLGHVFTDGPLEAGGKRYCINSAALRFVPLAELTEEQATLYQASLAE